MKIVIIGGVAGGASAAARARRLSEEAQIVVFEKGPDVSFANCGLPYHVGGEIPKREALLMQTPEGLKAKLNLDVRTNHEVTSIDPKARKVYGRNLRKGEQFEETYDHLIISTGANPVVPPIEGRDRPGVFTLRDLQDMDGIIDWIDRKNTERRAVVVGAGFIGLEMVEQLHHRGYQVTVVEAGDQVLTPLDREMAALVLEELKKQQVEVVLSEFVTSISDSSEAEVGLVGTKSGKCFPADLVLLSVGVRPNSQIAADAGVNLGPTGAVVVDEYLQTNIERIWAVGDVIEAPHPILKGSLVIPLGGPANRQGRIVADNILGRKTAYRGTLGTSIVRVFDLTAAATGASEKLLVQAQIPHQSVYLHPGSHAGYYPGAHPIALKLTYSPDDGTILGAQAVGVDGVDKRIDILATALHADMTVDDLTELELCYAPPYGSAKDPVNLAGMVAQNVLRGLVETVSPVHLPVGDDFVYLDVRSLAEREQGTINPSLHLPLPELRARLDELPKGKTLVAFCRSGQRSYNACRILSQNGFRCLNISGAYLSWKSVQNAG